MDQECQYFLVIVRGNWVGQEGSADFAKQAVATAIVVVAAAISVAIVTGQYLGNATTRQTVDARVAAWKLPLEDRIVTEFESFVAQNTATRIYLGLVEAVVIIIIMQNCHPATTAAVLITRMAFGLGSVAIEVVVAVAGVHPSSILCNCSRRFPVLCICHLKALSNRILKSVNRSRCCP